MNTFHLFDSLRNPRFARLYAAQTTSLLGDALTWVGLALLVFELAGKNSSLVLSTALTLRVTAFVLLSPLAGALADRFDRKKIMVITHLARMSIVSLLPFVTQVWQIYALIFWLNVFNAFFTPTYKATIPLVTGKNDYPQAIALSSATYQLLSVLGPGLAGAVAAFIGARQVFFLDAITFVVAAILIFSLPGQLTVESNQQPSRTVGRTLQDIKEGTTRLLTDAPIRYALAMQLVASIAGAQILVNTVGYVQGTLKLGEVQYGWVMAAFGIGATVCAVSCGCDRYRYTAYNTSSDRCSSYNLRPDARQLRQFGSPDGALGDRRCRAKLSELTHRNFDCRPHPYSVTRARLWRALCLESPVVGDLVSPCWVVGNPLC